jgi:hypothetical protein
MTMDQLFYHEIHLLFLQHSFREYGVQIQEWKYPNVSSIIDMLLELYTDVSALYALARKCV